MPWWIPLFRSRRKNWSVEEKSVFYRIVLTGTAIFFVLGILMDVYAKRHGGLRTVGPVPVYIFMALVWLMSFYVSRVVWEFLTPTLIKKADSNAALRLSR
jgi:hypothetical protein